MGLKKLVIVFVFICLLVLSNGIYASNFDVSLEMDNTNQNNSIVLILKLRHINFENIISTIEANLEYDKEIFSNVTIENLNEWSIVYNDKNTKLIGFKVSDKEINQEDLCKINLQLKENIKDTDTKIVLKDIKSADGEKLVKTEDKTISINVENNLVMEAKEQKSKITDKNRLKILLIIVELILIVTIINSTTYLIQKRKYKKLYEKSKPRKR